MKISFWQRKLFVSKFTVSNRTRARELFSSKIFIAQISLNYFQFRMIPFIVYECIRVFLSHSIYPPPTHSLRTFNEFLLNKVAVFFVHVFYSIYYSIFLLDLLQKYLNWIRRQRCAVHSKQYSCQARNTLNYRKCKL